MMTILTRASDRQTVSLVKQIADSGEGEVWETNFSGILAKIYHNPTPERIEKLKAMLANPPVDPMASKNHISIAFPQDLLQDGSGNFVGFLMPAVPSSRELPSIYNPRLRKRNAPGFNWYYLHVTALNTAWIIQAIHEKGYVLGDIKPQNILVNDRALVAVIDTDSFQVCDRNSGKVYRCTVGSDGFTPVELLGKDFAVTDQSEVCDRFRLAVLIHYLLFGYHPFSGEWTGAGESPEQTELIRKGLWYGGKNSLIRPSQNTIPLDVVHPEIKRLFLKCFNDGHASPKLRPTAEDWHNALQVAVNDLTICGKVDSHHYSRSYGKCYWCERSAKLGVDIFPAVSSDSSKAVNTTTTASTVIQSGSQSVQPSLNSLQLAQTVNNYSFTLSSSPSLELLETISVFLSFAGVFAASVTNQVALAAIPLFLVATFNLFNRRHLLYQFKKYLQQTVGNSSFTLSLSPSLELLETISVFLSFAGVFVASVTNQVALTAIPLFLVVTFNLFNRRHLLYQFKKYLQQTVNNYSFTLSLSPSLELLETISVFLSFAGVFAASVTNQVALTAIPLFLVVTFNLFNRRHLLYQFKKYLRSLGYQV